MTVCVFYVPAPPRRVTNILMHAKRSQLSAQRVPRLQRQQAAASSPTFLLSLPSPFAMTLPSPSAKPDPARIGIGIGQ